MRRYRHVIWDWNGTLLDDLSVVVDAMNGILHERSLLPLTPERYREIFTFPVQDYYVALGFDLEKEPFPVLAEEWVGAYGARWRDAVLRDEAGDVLNGLKGEGITQSVLSAAEQGLLDEQATHFGVHHHFSGLVGIDDHHAVSKVEHGRRWLRDAAIDPATVLLVGDTTHDREVATELGVDVALFAHGHQSHERLAASGAPVIDSLLSVPGIALNGFE